MGLDAYIYDISKYEGKLVLNLDEVYSDFRYLTVLKDEYSHQHENILHLATEVDLEVDKDFTDILGKELKAGSYKAYIWNCKEQWYGRKDYLVQEYVHYHSDYVVANCSYTPIQNDFEYELYEKFEIDIPSCDKDSIRVYYEWY